MSHVHAHPRFTAVWRFVFGPPCRKLCPYEIVLVDAKGRYEPCSVCRPPGAKSYVDNKSISSKLLDQYVKHPGIRGLVSLLPPIAALDAVVVSAWTRFKEKR